MVAKKKSKIVISQHTNIHILHTQIYYSHTHIQLYAPMYVCTLNASQLHLHLLIRKKFIFFKKCNPVPPCKQENDTMMTLMGTLYVCVCIFITHTHKHTDTIHKRTAAAHVSQYIQRHSHTHSHTNISSSLTLSHTHTIALARHSLTLTSTAKSFDNIVLEFHKYTQFFQLDYFTYCTTYREHFSHCTMSHAPVL